MSIVNNKMTSAPPKKVFPKSRIGSKNSRKPRRRQQKRAHTHTVSRFIDDQAEDNSAKIMSNEEEDLMDDSEADENGNLKEFVTYEDADEDSGDEKFDFEVNPPAESSNDEDDSSDEEDESFSSEEGEIEMNVDDSSSSESEILSVTDRPKSTFSRRNNIMQVKKDGSSEEEDEESSEDDEESSVDDDEKDEESAEDEENGREAKKSSDSIPSQVEEPKKAKSKIVMTKMSAANVRETLKTEEEKRLFDQVFGLYNGNPAFYDDFVKTMKEKLSVEDPEYYPNSVGCRLHNWITGKAQLFIRDLVFADNGNSKHNVPKSMWHGSQVYAKLRDEGMRLNSATKKAEPVPGSQYATLLDLFKQSYANKQVKAGWDPNAKKTRKTREKKKRKSESSADGSDTKKSKKMVNKTIEDFQVQRPTETGPSAGGTFAGDENDDLGRGRPHEQKEAENERVFCVVSNACMDYIPDSTKRAIEKAMQEPGNSLCDIMAIAHLGVSSNFPMYVSAVDLMERQATDWELKNIHDVVNVARDDKTGAYYISSSTQGKHVDLKGGVFFARAILRVIRTKLCFDFPLANLRSPIDEHAWNAMNERNVFRDTELSEPLTGWFVTHKKQILFLGSDIV